MQFSITQTNAVLSLIKHLEEIAPILFYDTRADLPSHPKLTSSTTAARIHFVIILMQLFLQSSGGAH